MNRLAVIPTIGLSEYLVPLIHVLRGDDFDVLLIDNSIDRPAPRTECIELEGIAEVLHRPGWRGIYKQWNHGLQLAETQGVTCLILNDDIVLQPGAPRLLADTLEAEGWAILGFDMYGTGVGFLTEAIEVRGSFRHGGVPGYAFGADPAKCSRVDPLFRWWGGDDDLFFDTARRGGRVGRLTGCGVEHPSPSLSANQSGHLLPDGWIENDRALLLSKWNDAW